MKNKLLAYSFFDSLSLSFLIKTLSDIKKSKEKMNIKSIKKVL